MRQIITDQNQVFLNENESYTVDCQPLRDSGIAYVGEDSLGLWVELDPFTGRLRNHETGKVSAAFQAAQAEKDKPETIEAAQSRRKAEVDAMRVSKLAQGLYYGFPDGQGTIQLRNESDFRNVQGIASSGQALIVAGDSSTTLSFRDAENVTHELTGQQALQMGLAVSAFISAHYKASWTHKDAISALTTPAAVGRYNLATGWPS